MSISPIAAKAAPGGGITLGSGLLPRQALFRTRDLEHGQAHMNVALGGEHSVSYLSRERRLDFGHRQAKIGCIAVHSLQYGAGVVISDALLPNSYLLLAGVSTRALQLSFRRFRNTTPMAYLRTVRLELARTELVNAGRQGSSVAAVANAVGLGHLGRFSRDYHARFGELPSHTLQRGSIARPR